jgi:benzoyl-CoA reductase/2-hydroxyglutaryl-CoA dehydratase subunit BcrC/BadD/HgdB
MTLEELLSYDHYDYNKIHEFVATKGLNNVDVEDLDKIVKKYGKDVLRIVDFFNLYNIVSTNDANKTMKKWTIRTGIMTLIVTIATIVNLILFTSTLW